MIVLDTNIIIYAATNQAIVEQFSIHSYAFASISRIESLGYNRITDEERDAITASLALGQQIGLTDSVIARAIRIRQAQPARIGLGDAIIAATALETDAELWTANTDDFAEIDGLKLVNPLMTT